jgi:hypothetical protein
MKDMVMESASIVIEVNMKVNGDLGCVTVTECLIYIIKSAISEGNVLKQIVLLFGSGKITRDDPTKNQ